MVTSLVIGRAFRCLAALLLLGAMLSPVPGRAQRRAVSVYVLDFNNETRVGGSLLGRIAAAQVSLQLSESAAWDVVPDAQVQRRIQDLNLRPPFDRVDRARIASGVDADAALYGTITHARVSSGANPTAYVRMRVLVEDVRTGTLISGVVMDGTATAREGDSVSADRLLEEAFGKAAFRGRELMDRARQPEGTVLVTTVVGGADRPRLDALVNIGARQGVRRGMRMLVTRQGVPVGTLRITTVDSDVSTGRITENIQGVRPEDHVRGLLDLTDLPTTPSAYRGGAEYRSGRAR
jgi:hypothetical protein